MSRSKKGGSTRGRTTASRRNIPSQQSFFDSGAVPF